MNATNVVIAPLTSDLIADAIALQESCFPPPFDPELLWKPEHLSAHLEAFPEGQFAALVGGVLAGTASSLIISEDVWVAHLDWEQTVGGHFLKNHTALGSTLYGADISVHPDFRGQGVARALYRARFALVERLGLIRYGTAVRMPDYQASGTTSVLEYAKLVESGNLTDRTLTPMIRMGLTLVGVIENYMDDPESGDSAALLEWQP